MRQLPGLALLMLSVGCMPTPNLKLRVESARTSRLAPEVQRQLEAADAAALRDIDRDLDRGRQRLANAEKALAAVRAEPVMPDAANVHAAKVERANCEVKWEQSVLRSAEWRRASTQSSGELAKAETLGRAGDNIDVAAYSAQHERMRSGLSEALRQQASMRSRFDESERALAAAKAHYAETHAAKVMARTGS